MMKCTKCGSEIQSNHLYCRSCGSVRDSINIDAHTRGVDDELQPAKAEFSNLESNPRIDSFVTSPSPVTMAMTMDRIVDGSDQATMLKENITFKLVSKHKTHKVVEAEYCCFPCIPCGICVCSTFELVQMDHEKEAVMVRYDAKTKMLRNVERHAQSLVLEWDRSSPGTGVTSWGCRGCPAAAKGYGWDVMSDGSILPERDHKLAIGYNGSTLIVENRGSSKIIQFDLKP